MNPYESVTQRLHVLREQVAEYVGSASRTIRATSQDLELRLGRAELMIVRRAPEHTENAEAFVGRVTSHLRTRPEEPLRASDVRRLGRLFRRFERELVWEILHRQPSGWRPFVDALFRERLEIKGPEWNMWSSIAAAAPSSVTLLHGPLHPARLLLEDPAESARQVAAQFRDEPSLARVDAVACAPGLLHRSWPYTSLVLARWAEIRGDCWRSSWDEVTQELLLEAMLLPRRDGERSWFGERGTRFPLAIPDHLEAQARFLAACFASWLRDGTPEDARLTTLLEILSSTRAWRDPRTFSLPRDEPESPGWKAFRAVDRETYEKLIERLLEEDLELFFDKMEDFDGRRRRYWKKQLRHIVSTTFFFSRETLEKLRREFTGQHPLHQKARNALQRARTLSDASGTDALCLTFRGGVVVEFSKTGNAVYQYTRERYQQIAPRGQQVSIHDLKRRRHVERWLAHHDGWESKFDLELLTVIRPGGRA